ncbi:MULTISPECIES: carbohydrate ABC transporter permease [unclassified Nesterenkonia]|uniref:carbohydrate ABC transporter permease n=1 Tax=unclassified Nesterenkonia TaxID=2629769 RepID=UPI0008720533|nr:MULTISPECIES: sugar ABC transporter permease [unclassified Nesterenkonia]MDS2173311.1 sugar ABC transporter permease [Nesterenkonia sp. CL21]OSM42991.1 ABC transporter [Nesterenkonia sp. PF2B19]
MTQTASPVRRGGTTGRRQKGPSFLMALPAVLFFGVFALIPLAGVVVLSFMSWDGLGSPSFVGLDNWFRILERDHTHNALWLTFVFVTVSFIFQAPVALLLGVFMAGAQKYRAFLSVLFFLPLLFSSVAVGLTFQALFSPNYGISTALPFDWLPAQWLGNPDIALYVVIFVVGWCFVPFHSLLYQAGVRQIPASLYEAATIDGAGRVRQFFSITLPQLRYTAITSSTLMLVGSLTYFDLVFVLTQGGPGSATRILPLDMYITGFRNFDMGGASVIAVILVAVGLTLSLALNKISGSSRMESDKAGMG